MNKSTLILVLAAAGILVLLGALFFLLFSNRETAPPETEDTTASLTSNPGYHVSEILEEANASFYRNFPEPLDAGEYDDIFEQASTAVSFQTLYPKLQEYRLYEILAWSLEDSEELSATFVGQQDNFVLTSTNKLTADILGPSSGEVIFSNNEAGALWEFREVTGTSYLLLFASQDVDGKTISSYLSSETLSTEQLINIANSILQ